MLDNTGTRQLAYVVIIDDITPIGGYDRVELAHVGGWTIVVGKGEFKAGDPAIYFEIDSKLPEIEPFTNMEFLSKKHYKIKTQRMCKSYSQGLLMSAANFGWEIIGQINIKTNENYYGIMDADKKVHLANDESRFLTKQLGVTYNDPEDVKRKAPSADKYKRMAQRHGKLFSKQPIRWLMQRTWGKKLLYVFFGKKKDTRNWPAWVHKTDEERVQNMPYILKDKSEWIATEKIDGTSTTFTIKRKHFPFKNEFYVCSRNVAFDEPNKKCYYDTNVYLEMAEKYHAKEVLTKMLAQFPQAEWITIQGETFGAGIQSRDYSLKDHDFRAFNLIMSHCGRLNTIAMQEILEPYGIHSVPVLSHKFILPDTVDELLTIATGKSVIDGGPREGIVFRAQDGTTSFKAVSNEYLLKFHQ